MTLISLAGKHCAIVGATGVIGASIARTFSQNGAVLSLISRSALTKKDSLEKDLVPPNTLASSTSNSFSPLPRSHRFFNVDVADRAAVKAAFYTKRGDVSFDDETKIGPVDVLVNCAGITQTQALKRMSEDGISDVIDTNLMATIWACKAAQVRNHGCIINVSSLMATKGGAGATAYAASKGGVVAFTRALCREFGVNSVRVNALLPGWVDSPMWDHLKDAIKQKTLDETPLNRIANPAEIADAALFLATNSFANNCVLNIDGGLSAT
ncbi:enoyl-(Acyl carrier protein) reductase domain-containing protein [Sarocladium implicatum]|nr:enoyl-(Acyl carrier protein) reductase domain-containing protein [Sarocladium implicatum]